VIDFTSIGIDLPYATSDNVRVICPRCGEYHHNRKKTLSCDTERGLFQCFRCGWKGRVSGGIGWTDYQPDPTALETHRSKRQFAIDAVLRESVPISAESAQVARRYLRTRGVLSDLLPSLRYHPALRYYHDKKCQGEYPALIADVRDITGRLVTLHRTYLTDDGRKAPVESPKKIMGVPQGSCTGAAIRLYTAYDELVIAEGIESALAMSCMLHLPAWAAVSAHGMENVLLPESVRAVHIGADNDKSGRGQDAAEYLAARLSRNGIAVWIHTPDIPGTDWADVRACA
jgi:putative DNA primase/helicase